MIIVEIDANAKYHVSIQNEIVLAFPIELKLIE